MADFDRSPPPALWASSTDARATLVPPGQLSVSILKHGALDVRWYAPSDTDPQFPHDRDEVYVVVSGTGTFVRMLRPGPFDEVDGFEMEERAVFSPGDVLVAPAGAVHRFEDFSADFAAWAIFSGPEGGT